MLTLDPFPHSYTPQALGFSRHWISELQVKILDDILFQCFLDQENHRFEGLQDAVGLFEVLFSLPAARR
jgi:hypothetical protein